MFRFKKKEEEYTTEIIAFMGPHHELPREILDREDDPDKRSQLMERWYGRT